MSEKLTRADFIEECFRISGAESTVDKAFMGIAFSNLFDRIEDHSADLQAENHELRIVAQHGSCNTCSHWAADSLVTGEGHCRVFNDCVTEYDFYCKDFEK